MEIYSPAKINLALDILQKDKNGYHVIQSIFQIIDIFDVITIESTKDKNPKIEVIFKGEEAQEIDKSNNTITQAFNFLNVQFGLKYSYKITVEKNIPVGAGLGGGSSDAASVIKAIDEIEGLNLSFDSMRETGSKIGMDVPLFIEGETLYGTHYGEEVQILPAIKNIPGWKEKYKILIIPPTSARKKTAEKYSRIDVNLTGNNKQKTDLLLEAIKSGDTDKIIENSHNDFEIFEGEGFKSMKLFLEEEEGALKALLCGAGNAVFAISNNPFDAASLSRALPNQRILNLNQ